MEVTHAARADRPFIFTNCFTGEGLDEVMNRTSLSSPGKPDCVTAAAWCPRLPDEFAAFDRPSRAGCR
jgi:hypothetical protein